MSRLLRRSLLGLAFAVYAAAAGAAIWSARNPEVALAQETDGLTAPELPAGLSWINTDQPITLASLRGQVVVLDFWTYG